MNKSYQFEEEKVYSLHVMVNGLISFDGPFQQKRYEY